MKTGTKLLLALNKLFKAPIHPFNLQNEGVKSYAMWQFERGAQTIAFYTKRYSQEEMFKNKTVVDIGCGAAGKSLYYASCGADKVIGVEILEKYRAEAEKLAADLNLADKFEFVCADAAHLPFEENSIDTIIMNDAMEHVDNPEAVLTECLRVIRKGGRIFINFPPYYHPTGAHLSDAIFIPWVHMFFREDVLIESYKHLAKNYPDGAERIEFRISENAQGEAYFSYINHMTIRRYKKILNKLGITPAYYKEEPLRSIVAPLAKLPLFKEMFVKMAVSVIEK